MQKLSTNQRQGNLVPIFVLYLRKWLVSSGLSIYDFAVVSVFGFFKIFFKFGEGLVVFFKVGDVPVSRLEMCQLSFGRLEIAGCLLEKLMVV